MLVNSKYSYKIGVVEWFKEIDGLPQVIHDELSDLGHYPQFFWHDGPIPEDIDVLFTWAPYGKLLPILQQLEALPLSKRPITAHWNTEGIPDLRLPWHLVRAAGSFRTWIERVSVNSQSPFSDLLRTVTSPWDNRALRFRYFGDYYYAYNHGLLDVFADSSILYAHLHNQHGLPTIVAPWGSTNRWREDLELDRDIDVLWMGKRGTRRRSKILDQVRSELQHQNVEFYFADNEERPFIFGKERTQLLNRAKITLNVTRTWYDDNYSRFSMAAPNRSLIVSEPILPHCPQFVPGVHFVSASIDKLPETISYYLQHDEAREHIVENAYRLTTAELTFQNSIKKIMDAVDRVMCTRERIRK
jgi:hypothetical protein